MAISLNQHLSETVQFKSTTNYKSMRWHSYSYLIRENRKEWKYFPHNLLYYEVNKIKNIGIKTKNPAKTLFLQLLFGYWKICWWAYSICWTTVSRGKTCKRETAIVSAVNAILKIDCSFLDGLLSELAAAGTKILFNQAVNWIYFLKSELSAGFLLC